MSIMNPTRQALIDQAETVIAQCLAGEEVRFWLDDEWAGHLSTMVYELQMARAQEGQWFDLVWDGAGEWDPEARRNVRVFRHVGPRQKAPDLSRNGPPPWYFATQDDLDRDAERVTKEAERLLNNAKRRR